MLIAPVDGDFAREYQSGRAQVCWTRLVADLETPVSAMLKVSAGRANCFLLESVEGGAVRGRYSIIGIEPDVIFRVRDGAAEINRDVINRPSEYDALTEPPLDALRALIAESRIDLPDALPPMAAGIFGYLGYDMVRHMEVGSPRRQSGSRLGVPDSHADAADHRWSVFDNRSEDKVTAGYAGLAKSTGVSAEAAYGLARERHGGSRWPTLSTRSTALPSR